MAKLPPAETTTSNPPKPQPPKLPRLANNLRITKRPLLHPPIASPHSPSTTERTIYISTTSPFISITKRVYKLLEAQKPRLNLNMADHSATSILRHLAEEDRARGSRGGEGDGKVVLKATGKAIEKALGVAMWFQARHDVSVELRTGSVGAVDDVVYKNEGEGEGVGEEEEEESSRVRRVSCLEIWVRGR